MKKLIIFIYLLNNLFSNAQNLSWQKITTPTTKDLNCIVFPSPEIGYIGGVDSLLLKTIDGGKTWFELAYKGITFVPSQDDFLELNFISENIGYATLGASGIYSTFDGGLNWSSLKPSLCYNHAIYYFLPPFFDIELCGSYMPYMIIGGTSCDKNEQLRYINFLDTTSNLKMPSLLNADTIVDIEFENVFPRSLFGLAVSKGGRIYRTNDGGLSWDTISLPLTNKTPFTSVTIVNQNLAYISYSNGGLLISKDAGLTWSLEPNTTTFLYPKINDLYTFRGKTFFGGSNKFPNSGLIMESNEFGIWNMYKVDEEINSFTSSIDTVIWGTGKNGFLVRAFDKHKLSVNHLKKEEKLVLFPNPTSDIITIDILNEVENNEFVIEIYSTEGKLIKKGDTGKNYIQISELASGNYTVKVTLGSRILTTKFIYH